MDMVESLAVVTQLEAKKSTAETYQTFYQLYGEEQLQVLGGHTVLNRVLHFDVDDRRDVHVVIARANNSINLPVLRAYDQLGRPAHRMRYSSSDFLVASTDGVTITQYEVNNLEGTYRDDLNGVDKQYDPWYETIQVDLASEAGQGSAVFMCATGDGVFTIPGQPIGWILSETESRRLRDEVLREETIPHLGHTAVAS